MKRLLAALVLLVAGCDPQPANPPMNGWAIVGYTPDGGEGLPGTAIYKKHNDQEKVTLYATRVHYGWSISVVKDER